MSINLNSQIIADARFLSAHGMPGAGAYFIRLSVGFQVQNWPEQENRLPVVRLLDSQVTLTGSSGGVFLGYGRPETSVPFRVGRYAHSTGVLYSLQLSPQALEAIEAKRAGDAVVLQLKVQAEVMVGTSLETSVDEVRCSIAQSDWLRILEECGYGRSLLFEVPVPTSLGPDGERVLALLKMARQALVEGRYSESVAACRGVLEAITKSMGQGSDLTRVREVKGPALRELGVSDRGLRLRAAALDYAHLAHHPSEMQPDCVYDRRQAQMLMGVTVSLASAAFGQLFDTQSDS